MKTTNPIFLLLGASLCLLLTSPAFGQTTVVADDYNVTGGSTGLSPGTGINSGIAPPTTRLTGTAAPDLRYIRTAPKTCDAFGIVENKLEVAPAADPGRFVLSVDGSSSFDFASAVGAAKATPNDPVIYDLSIRMANSTEGPQRFSFALGTSEGTARTWSFGIQLYSTNDTDDFYPVGKRIARGSSGLADPINTFITQTEPGTHGSEIDFVMRVTDAGAEADTFNSRVQLSIDGGATWFYDTSDDPDLPDGWRMDGPGRHIMWDVAPNAGPVTYDDFSLVVLPPISVELVSPKENSGKVGVAPELEVAVDNDAPDDLTVTFFGREAPTPQPGPDFAIAVLPDTQNYARENSSRGNAKKEMWFAQTDWIVANRVSQNIAYVAHLGDCVQNGDIKGGRPNHREWNIATNAMYRLENRSRTQLRHGIPYGIAVGNHDQEPARDPRGTTDLYNEHFGSAHFSGRPYYGGHFGSNNDNHYDLFSAGGLDFIVFYFEFGRHGSVVLNWAKEVMDSHPNRRAIVVTHHAGSPRTPSRFSAQGAAIYEALKTKPNFFLMLAGHRNGEGSRQDVYNGNTVRTFISNYQFRMNGGNGWMRMIYFSPENNTVTIKTYSPWLDKYETDGNSQIIFSYDIGPSTGRESPDSDYVPLGTNDGVSPGSSTSLAWPKLQENKTYDWYVTVTDEDGNRITSPKWRFSTTNTPPVADK